MYLLSSILTRPVTATRYSSLLVRNWVCSDTGSQGILSYLFSLCMADMIPASAKRLRHQYPAECTVIAGKSLWLKVP